MATTAARPTVPVPTDTTIYYRYATGSVSARTITTQGDLPDPPEGATVITEQEYQDALAAVIAARDAHRADIAAAESAAKAADYQALTAAGIPEATARRLSGWQDDQ